MKFKLSAIFLAAFVVSSCSNDAVREINQGNEITFNTSVSRAQHLSNDNLEIFRVWAVWPKVGQTFIDGVDAKKPDKASYFAFDRAVFWPNDVEQLNFYAVAPFDTDGVQITSETKNISNFKVNKVLADQVDLIVAYTEADRGGSTNVKLNFKHALSQVIVQAKAGYNDDDNKTVTLKGAWIMNVKPQGTLALEKESKTEDGKTFNDVKFDWESAGEKTFYGREFDNSIELKHNVSNLLHYESAQSNMLLIPQQLDTWLLSNDEYKESNKDKGAYIVLLCRVEATHNGKLHDGATDPAVFIDETNKKHIHQMFPYTGTFDKDEYGYTCVPINTDWEPGKKYIYTLTFCGQTSGAGIYPPTGELDDLPTKKDENDKDLYIKKIPVGINKKIGDPVLDNPIQFTVSVTEWDGDENWKPGQIDDMK